LLFAEKRKDSLLKNTKSPRIIFVGGSNLSFGLDCQMIKESLNVNPINTAIHAALGLTYMLDNTYMYIKRGDIVVVVPEYNQFYGDYGFGSEELLRTVWDVNKSKIRLLSLKQIKGIVPYIPDFLYSKLKITEYINVQDSDVYSVNSFNEYGDVFTHWDLERHDFSAYGQIDVNHYNIRVMKKLKEFEEKIHRKGAMLYVSYPSLQDSSFDNSIDAINKIEKEFIKYGFAILGNPERYRMDDVLMFNTPYHLNRNGVNLRTQLLIEDLKEAGAHARVSATKFALWW
jgi:hypothetical protein